MKIISGFTASIVWWSIAAARMLSAAEPASAEASVPVAAAESGAAVKTAVGAAKASGSVAQLAFLTGTWRGTASNGRAAEEMISVAEGGVMLSAGREFKDGRCVFFDLVVFAEKAGVVTLIPHPNGKVSKDVFPATTIDAGLKRAVFENLAHDFPKRFVYEIVGGNVLRITLSGEIKGKAEQEVYELKRVL